MRRDREEFPSSSLRGAALQQPRDTISKIHLNAVDNNWSREICKEDILELLVYNNNQQQKVHVRPTNIYLYDSAANVLFDNLEDALKTLELLQGVSFRLFPDVFLQCRIHKETREKFNLIEIVCKNLPLDVKPSEIETMITQTDRRAPFVNGFIPFSVTICDANSNKHYNAGPAITAFAAFRTVIDASEAVSLLNNKPLNPLSPLGDNNRSVVVELTRNGQEQLLAGGGAPGTIPAAFAGRNNNTHSHHQEDRRREDDYRQHRREDDYRQHRREDDYRQHRREDDYRQHRREDDYRQHRREDDYHREDHRHHHRERTPTPPPPSSSQRELATCMVGVLQQRQDLSRETQHDVIDEVRGLLDARHLSPVELTISKGTCFVKFRTLQEAVDCIEATRYQASKVFPGGSYGSDLKNTTHEHYGLVSVMTRCWPLRFENLANVVGFVQKVSPGGLITPLTHIADPSASWLKEKARDAGARMVFLVYDSLENARRCVDAIDGYQIDDEDAKNGVARLEAGLGRRKTK